MRTINRRSAVALGVGAAFSAPAERHKVPVAVAMVADKDRILQQSKVGADENSIFLIASMTKAITSAAAMQLVEKGSLELDAPAHNYLPALRDLPILEGVDDAGKPRFSTTRYAVTLRQLLAHTAGFGYPWNHPLVLKLGAFDKPYLVNKPGTKWHYGTNIDWVGRIVEAVSKQTLEAYFLQHIFQPLGMKDTSFLLPPEKFDRFLGFYQRDAAGVLRENPRVQPPVPTSFNGGGGLLSTAADYIRFTQMILRRGLAADGTRVLQARTVKAMSSNQTGELEAGKIRSTMLSRSRDVDFHTGHSDRFGLGFLINPKPYDGGRSAGSLAWAGLYNTFYWIDPKRGISAVLMMNFLPFCDDAAMAMLREFERSVYTQLR
jgi:methyl acetate hydrolase